MTNKYKLLMIGAITLSAVSLGVEAGFFSHGIKGNGDMSTQTIKADDIQSIVSRGAFHVRVLPGSQHSISVKGDSNLLPYITMQNVNGKLILATKKDVSLNPTAAFDVTITGAADHLNSIKTAGKMVLDDEHLNTSSFYADTKGKFVGTLAGSVKSFDFNLSGKSIVSLNATADNINLKVSGKNETTLKGAMNAFNIAASGKTIVDAKECVTQNLNVSSRGKFKITANVIKRMNLSTRGQARVDYLGNPEIKKNTLGDFELNQMKGNG
jgi:hypothetical protein